MDARPVVTAAEPLGALRLVPERADQLPRITAIVRAEESARERAGPETSGLVSATRFETPDLFQRRRIAGLDRDVLERRHPAFLPGTTSIGGSVELHAEVAKVERGVDGAVTRIVEHHRDGLSEETGLIDCVWLISGEREQSLSRGHPYSL